MIFGAIFGIKDPLRPKIREAVEQCHHSGINVRMVTGDIVETAKAISLEAGIITEKDLADEENNEYLCMTGEQFRTAIMGSVDMEEVDEEVENSDGEKEMKKVKKVKCTIGNKAKFRQIEKQLKVMARSQPDDKFMLVHGLIEE